VQIFTFVELGRKAEKSRKNSSKLVEIHSKFNDLRAVLKEYIL